MPPAHAPSEESIVQLGNVKRTPTPAESAAAALAVLHEQAARPTKQAQQQPTRKKQLEEKRKISIKHVFKSIVGDWQNDCATAWRINKLRLQSIQFCRLPHLRASRFRALASRRRQRAATSSRRPVSAMMRRRKPFDGLDSVFETVQGATQSWKCA